MIKDPHQLERRVLQLEQRLARMQSCCDEVHEEDPLVIIYQFSGTNTANAMRYMWPFPGNANIDVNAGELVTDGTQVLMPFAGTLRDLHIQMSPSYPNGGLPGNLTRFTVRKNGVGNLAIYDTDLEIALQIGEVGGSGFDNETDTVPVAAGDKIGLTYYPVTMNGLMTCSVYGQISLVVT